MANLNLTIAVQSKFMLAFVTQGGCSCALEVLCSLLTSSAVSCSEGGHGPVLSAPSSEAMSGAGVVCGSPLVPTHLSSVMLLL